jgi:hypothetical protein
MMDNIHRQPRLQQQHHTRWLRAPPGPAFHHRNPCAHAEVAPEYLDEPSPYSQPLAWENWALWRMVRRELGLTDHEIRFLLGRDRAEAAGRWM